MDPKKAVIAGSIGLVLIGLVLTGVIVYRQRTLSEPPIEPSGINVLPTSTPPPVPTAAATPATEILPVVSAPDYTDAKDTDGDELLDPQEIANGTDPKKADTDGDSYNDYEELMRGTSPIDSNSHPAEHQQKKQ